MSNFKDVSKKYAVDLRHKTLKQSIPL